MSDVLTAEQAKNLADTVRLYIPPDAFGAFNVVAENALAALARSHEALRGELREAQVSVYDALEMLATARNERDAAVEAGMAHEQRLRTDLEASARAAGSATDALTKIAEQQPKTLAMIEANGFVFDSIGREPGNWQHLAFSIYTDLCEADTLARSALAVLGHATPAAAGKPESVESLLDEDDYAVMAMDNDPAAADEERAKG